ncbi:MAG: gamma-glutamylcyclotransferase [Oscillatoriales cyanobacterium]|nr:MAG: gamma-glutamylcyclotransferase [Oscillatoriales cyanobacterium]TAF41964.1 MAG: gamma-glutamylcyclotransferase [Oscillatoriales cyanobacterium]TAF67909.1 MAG: gamma-glutamylcyclotransferase [Oscillatoriales cyanobacterium]
MKVFVYGTLKPGECNYLRYCEGKVVSACPAIARGQLFALPAGYPAMISGEGRVYGFLLCFGDSAILPDLDALEEYDPERQPAQNEYQRQEIEIFDLNCQSLGTAWVYLMLPDRLRSLRGIFLPDGTWKNRLYL